MPHTRPRHRRKSVISPFAWMAVALAVGLMLVASVPVLSWLAIRDHNTSAATAAPTPPAVKTFVVQVQDDTVVGGLPITVQYGDRVFIDIQIGQQHEAEFKIPGLLQSTTVERGGDKHFEFTAHKRGTFEVVIANNEPWEGRVFSNGVGTFTVE